MKTYVYESDEDLKAGTSTLVKLRKIA